MKVGLDPQKTGSMEALYLRMQWSSRFHGILLVATELIVLTRALPIAILYAVMD
jgi:hypothetical protein